VDWLVPSRNLFLAIHVLGIGCFAFIVWKRLLPLLHAQHDPRFDHPLIRIGRVFQFWVGQWRHPRYRFAGTLHILIFVCFLLLAARAFTVLIVGVHVSFVMPGLSGSVGELYETVTDYAATVVFLCMVIAAVRRLVFKPVRYDVPPKFGKAHTADAIFLLGLIALLMVADSLFSATRVAGLTQHGQAVEALALFSLPWALQILVGSASLATLGAVNITAYLVHAIAFYFLLCYRPFGIQFHVETSLFSIYFSKLERGTVKPVRWDVADEHLDQVKSFGVKTFGDFTWKHVLDFYSCADCGRCADNCPSNAVGRPLAPRFLTTKARDYVFEHYPVFGKGHNGQSLVGTIYSEDEIWSCTTCGACEEECPLLVEYIDNIVDLRRGLIDDGKVPQSLQKPLKALESRGNPYGKMEKKRGDWAKPASTTTTPALPNVRVLNGKNDADTLYFVDSITSYDDRMQSIGRATARILSGLGTNFGILGTAEKDSGHEVRRFGEELLFQSLRDHNTDAIQASGVERIVTADPHAFNALKHDYKDLPPVEHISQVLAREARAGNLRFNSVEMWLEEKDCVYTYHDPCYLGRHNQVYDDPRDVLDSIPGLKRVEMQRCRDRSFCCGGGGLMLFYEPKEEQRMGVVRVRMAADAGANVIVTACPFCMVNIEDAIKVAGMENTMSVMDLTEVVDQHLIRKHAEKSEELETANCGG
jgi:Fe-S oxidoreductase